MMNIAGMFRKVLNGQSNPVQIAWAMAPVMLYSNATYVYDPNICNCLQTNYSLTYSGIIVILTSLQSLPLHDACRALSKFVLELALYHEKHGVFQSSWQVDYQKAHAGSVCGYSAVYYWKRPISSNKVSC